MLVLSALLLHPAKNAEKEHEDDGANGKACKNTRYQYSLVNIPHPGYIHQPNDLSDHTSLHVVKRDLRGMKNLAVALDVALSLQERVIALEHGNEFFREVIARV
ncbi:MAG: hypothetical protein H7840_08035 [Alphaproteobacteria bacterium]